MTVMNEAPLSLNERMKTLEKRTRTFLPAQTYTMLRLDGKAFHSYTRGLTKPYDEQFIADMNTVAAALCEQVSGTALGYVQSDEISLLLTDFASDGTQAWFGGQVQKMVSISSAIASATMSTLRPQQGLALFDARIFTLPTASDVEDYFVWRQRDARKNSISMAAYTYFSHRKMASVNSDGRLAALADMGVDWNDYPQGFRQGRMLTRQTFLEQVSYTRRDTQTEHTQMTERRKWVVQDAPEFSDGNRNWTGPDFPRK